MKKNLNKIKEGLKLVKKIQNIRSQNNKNWMDILRLAVTKAPKEARIILKKINSRDRKINSLLSKIK